MFAVPGWSLPSNAPKTQKLPITNTVESAKPKDANEDDNNTQSSKKRKRKEKKAQEVTAANLADVWGKVIEGNEKSKVKEPKDIKKKAKETTVSDVNGASTVVKEAEEDVTVPATGEDVPRVKTAREEQREKKREKKRKLKEIESTDLPTDSAAAPPPAKKVQASVPKASQVVTTTQLPKAASTAHLTPLQASMRQKLISARFRHLNQELYTTPSKHSLDLFSKNPEMFQEYHEGFRRQVEVWPENPVDGYIAQIKARGKVRSNVRGTKGNEDDDESETKGLTPLPRTSGTCNIADLGCGDGALSTTLQPFTKKLKLSINSYDLQSPSPLITKADIANLPLADNTIDVAIFCLALMGTNWIDFIEEAWRVLRWKGELWISEIKSRFGRVGSSKSGQKVVSHSVGNRKKTVGKKEAARKEEEANEANLAVEVDGNDTPQETDVSAFVEVLSKRGFVLSTDSSGRGEVDLSNRMFVKMCFTKAATPIKGKCVMEEKFEKSKAAQQGKQTWQKKLPKRFVEEDEEGGEQHISSEAGVLKPCVYKIR